MLNEVNRYVADKRLEMLEAGKKPDRDDFEKLEKEKRKLARKFADRIAAIKEPTPDDYYCMVFLYDISEEYDKAFEAARAYLSLDHQYTEVEKLQSVKRGLVILSSRTKNLDVMEQAFEDWQKVETRPAEKRELEYNMAIGFYKGNEYEKAIKYAESAFRDAKDAPSKTLAEKSYKDKFYGDLVEILSLSYRKADRKDDALEILAESRAMSFSIPSAKLYRRVMQLVEGFGISEKKLMEKVESFDTSDQAPELEIKEWLGQEPTTLENLRGKVILLDFWATWCGPCISTFPRLRNWQEKYADEGFVIIGVTRYWGRGDQRPMTPLQEYDFLGDFKKKHKLPYGFAISNGSPMDQYGVDAYPTTILIDRRGVIRYIGIGAGREENANLGDMIKKVVRETGPLEAKK
ncbi:MAG: TlpA disulfide reductase family protein [Pyrinomonadaceae bacterium]